MDFFYSNELPPCTTVYVNKESSYSIPNENSSSNTKHPFRVHTGLTFRLIFDKKKRKKNLFPALEFRQIANGEVQKNLVKSKNVNLSPVLFLNMFFHI